MVEDVAAAEFELGAPLAPGSRAAAAARGRAAVRARVGDPQTSHEAANAFCIAQLKDYQYDIFRLFSLFGPAHDEDLVRRAKLHGVKQKDAGIRTRRQELVERGLLRDAGKRVVLTDSHRESIVWEVNPHPPLPTPSAPSATSGGGTSRS